jgi:diguanylate cyclase (GGDEF)-like protein/PAS domain S-box-containing protein
MNDMRLVPVVGDRMRTERRFVGARWLVAAAVAIAALSRRIRRHGAAPIERMGRLLFEHSPESVSVADAAKRIVAINPAYARVTGYTQTEVLGKALGFDATAEQDESLFRGMRAELTRVGRWTAEIWQRRRNGEAYAEHLDALTKLPNRTLLLERLSREMVRSRQSNRSIAVLSVDIDSFKRVNDSVGPTIGDRLLSEASIRIATAVSENATVARLGSDKFAVMIPEATSAEASRVALAILEAFHAPFVPDGPELVVTVSIGVAMYPEDGNDELRLLQRADSAMAQAKVSGGNAVAFFETEMNARAERRHAVETDLRRALKSDQLVVHYQPVVDRRTNAVVSAEALLRWQHPDRGLVPPCEFIPIAEESGLIVEIGRWVIDAVQRQLDTWRNGPLGALRVAVNLSARELRKADDLDALSRAIGRTAQSLSIEITESALLSDTERLLVFLSRLRDMGARLSLDDFGTGYSSLAYLRRFRFDVLKIDRSFVAELETSDADFALVSSITSLGHILGLDVIAEGVETDRQLARIADAGCDLVQGYHFAPPMPADAFAAYVVSRSS